MEHERIIDFIGGKAMSFIDSGMDLIVKKFAGKDTIRIEPEQFLQIVQEEFILNADGKRLDFLYKMAKGCFLSRKLLSKNERYIFSIGELQQGFIWYSGRTVWVEDLEKKCFYRIDDRKWRTFKKLFRDALNQEVISRR